MLRGTNVSLWWNGWSWRAEWDTISFKILNYVRCFLKFHTSVFIRQFSYSVYFIMKLRFVFKLVMQMKNLWNNRNYRKPPTIKISDRNNTPTKKVFVCMFGIVYTVYSLPQFCQYIMCFDFNLAHKPIKWPMNGLNWNLTKIWAPLTEILNDSISRALISM